MWFGMTQEMIEAYGQGEETATKESKEKAEQAAADAKKSPDEKLQDGFRACKEAGYRLPGRLLGIVDRETGKMTDQYTQLEGHEEEVSRIIMESFLDELDNILAERGLIEIVEENNES